MPKQALPWTCYALRRCRTALVGAPSVAGRHGNEVNQRTSEDTPETLHVDDSLTILYRSDLAMGPLHEASVARALLEWYRGTLH